MRRFRVRFPSRFRSPCLPSQYDVFALDLKWAVEVVRFQCRSCGIQKQEFDVREVGLLARKA